MKSLSFNEGYERFMINDDPSRVIRFNPADPEIINRILKVQESFVDYQMPEDIELNPDGSPKSDMEKEGAFIAEFTSKLRGAFNDIFNADVYDLLFNGQSPLCIVGAEPRYLYEEILDVLKEQMTPAMEAYRERNKTLTKKMEKYLEDV